MEGAIAPYPQIIQEFLMRKGFALTPYYFLVLAILSPMSAGTRPRRHVRQNGSNHFLWLINGVRSCQA
jgi:hypothetical protein